MKKMREEIASQTRIVEFLGGVNRRILSYSLIFNIFLSFKNTVLILLSFDYTNKDLSNCT